MTSKSGKSKQEEALQFLDDLDSLPPAPPDGLAKPGNEGEAAEVLAFLDEITQKSSEPTRTTTSHLERPGSRSTTPVVRKSAERVKLGASSSGTSSPLPHATPPPVEKQEEQKPASGSGGGWGWGSVWSNASTVLQQAKSVVDEQVKHLPKNDQARKWGEGMLEYAKAADLDKLGKDFKRVGLSTLTDILNAVAPPISEHEVIQVWLSHDMQGYEGVETLVYRALARIMEQVEGGDLVVNKGNETRAKDEATDPKRDMNAVDGYEAALKLAQADLADVAKRNPKPEVTEPAAAQNPTTHSYVYLRIQPFYTNLLQPTSASGSTPEPVSSLQFLLYLSDPAHNLSHTTVTQVIPGRWLDLWDQYEWVEDLCVEALRVGVEVLGQEYITARMGWGKGKEEAPAESSEEEEDDDDDEEEEEEE